MARTALLLVAVGAVVYVGGRLVYGAGRLSGYFGALDAWDAEHAAPPS